MDVQAAERKLEAAQARLQKLASFGAPYGHRVGAEQQYAEAYQDLVRLGARSQLRLKYRR
jgi:hypothetical protein